MVFNFEKVYHFMAYISGNLFFFFQVAEDLDGDGAILPFVLSWGPFNIVGWTGLTMSVLLADGEVLAMDENDFIRVWEKKQTNRSKQKKPQQKNTKKNKKASEKQKKGEKGGDESWSLIYLYVSMCISLQFEAQIDGSATWIPVISIGMDTVIFQSDNFLAGCSSRNSYQICFL